MFIAPLIDQHNPSFCAQLAGQSHFFVFWWESGGVVVTCAHLFENSGSSDVSNDATLAALPALLASCAAASPSTSAPRYYADLLPSWPPGNAVCRFASCIPALHVGRGKVGSSHIIMPFIHPSIHQPTTFPLVSSQYRRGAGCSLNKLSAHLRANVHIFGS